MVLACQLWKSASKVKILNHNTTSLLEEDWEEKVTVGYSKEETYCREHSSGRKSRISPQHLMFLPRTSHTTEFFFFDTQETNNITRGWSVTDNEFPVKSKELISLKYLPSLPRFNSSQCSRRDFSLKQNVTWPTWDTRYVCTLQLSWQALCTRGSWFNPPRWHFPAIHHTN